LAILTVMLILSVTSFGQSLIFLIMCFLLPAYNSFKALRSSENADDDKQWLTYWIVFSFFTFFDSFLSQVFHFIPYFGLFRLAFMILIYTKSEYGVLKIYELAIKPAFTKAQTFVDQPLLKVEKILGLVE
jgi:receptor expression-enhancing protein 5/6